MERHQIRHSPHLSYHRTNRPTTFYHNTYSRIYRHVPRHSLREYDYVKIRYMKGEVSFDKPNLPAILFTASPLQTTSFEPIAASFCFAGSRVLFKLRGPPMLFS
jgi:hypothetical protein